MGGVIRNFGIENLFFNNAQKTMKLNHNKKFYIKNNNNYICINQYEKQILK